MSAEAEIQDVLETIDCDGGVDDPLMVASLVIFMDACTTLKELRELQERASKEEISYRDRMVLGKVMQDCKRALRGFTYGQFRERKTK